MWPVILLKSGQWLGIWVVPVNPHLVTCDYLRKEFWICLKPVLKVLACVDMIFLWLHTLQVGHEYDGNPAYVWIVIQNVWTDPLEISDMLATSLIVILLFSRTKSWAYGIFSWVHTTFDLGKPLKNFRSSHCLLSKSCFQYFKRTSISRNFPILKQNFI